MELTKKLAAIQQSLNVGKSRENKFGGYFYRNLEDIMEAVKPLLGDLVLTFSDEVKQVGDCVYIQSTVKISDGANHICTTALARETMEKKKYDSSQLTGSASSYARKYAANGLFCLDDVKDSDHSNKGAHQESEETNKTPTKGGTNEVNWYNSFDSQKGQMIAKIRSGEQTAEGIIQALKTAGYAISKDNQAKIKGLK